MKNRATKFISLALCTVVLFAAVGTSVFALTGEGKEGEDENQETTINASAEAETSKDETVYVLAGADGTVQKIIVSDWIKNAMAADSLEDKTELSDIENIKGDESFTLGGDNSCVWDAQGNDIYYQGNIEKELPVQMSVCYTLDGQAIAPEALAGQSGHVTIRFDYQNMQHEEVLLDGKTEKIYVPFTMLTGMLLDTEVFRNVTISNGKLINDGDRIAVVGIAFPGLQEDLAISKEKLDIPDYVEISADVENFEMGMTMTLATTELFGAIDSDKLDLHELSDAMAELTDAMDQLMDGSSQLYDGLCTLLEKSGDLVSGINKLAEGTAQLKAGAESLDSGAAQFQAGAAQLSSGLNTLNANSSSLNGGARQVFSSLLSMANTQLSEAGLSVPALTIDNYASVLDGVIASLDDTAVYQAALEQVTATVNANRGMIEEKVTEAVQAQVEAEVSAQVTAAVQETVTQAVHENEAQFRAAVIQQALGMTVEEYKAAIEAGLVTQEQQDAVNAAVEAAMQAEIDARMQREEIQAQINAVTQQTVGEQMQSDEIQALIASNTELQVQQAISEAMSSDAVQAQLSAAAEGAKSVIALKSSLDSYNAFYLGLITYTSGVSSAAAGANELKTGADALKAGTSELSAGAAELLQGIQTMKDSAPALVDGITQLRDGSMELSDGLKQFNEEGIQKLIEAVDGDLDGLSNRIRVTADVAKHYTSFSGICRIRPNGVRISLRAV
jgi:putative membrane protein